MNTTDQCEDEVTEAGAVTRQAVQVSAERLEIIFSIYMLYSWKSLPFGSTVMCVDMG